MKKKYDNFSKILLSITYVIDNFTPQLLENHKQTILH